MPSTGENVKQTGLLYIAGRKVEWDRDSGEMFSIIF